MLNMCSKQAHTQQSGVGPLWLISTAWRLGDKNSIQECREGTAVLLNSHLPLASRILEQSQEYGYEVIADQLQSKATIRNRNKEQVSKKQMTSTAIGQSNSRK